MSIQKQKFLLPLLLAVVTTACSTSASTAPASVAAAVSPGTGEQSCVLTDAGGVQCWGNNEQGAVGDGTTTTHTIPVAVVGLSSGVTRVAAGAFFSCAIIAGGGVQCWGENAVGSIGDGTTTSRLTPVDVSGISSGATLLTSGLYFSCAVVSGNVQCWGRNTSGQLGDGTTTDSLTPVAVAGLGLPVISVCAGSRHTCVVTNDNRAKCFGDNTQGQVGDDTPGADTVLTPTDVVDLDPDIASVVCGDQHTCALTTGGAVKCWGATQFGQLGNGVTGDLASPSPNPVDVTGFASGVAEIAANGSSHTCARTSSGAVQCWGANGGGALGNNTTTHSNVPVQVTGLTSGVSAIGAGGGVSCAILSTGDLQCWGGTYVGDDSGSGSLTPANVIGF